MFKRAMILALCLALLAGLLICGAFWRYCPVCFSSHAHAYFCPRAQMLAAPERSLESISSGAPSFFPAT